MLFNTIFNNILAISWRSVLLEETGLPREKHRSAASRLSQQNLYSQYILYCTSLIDEKVTQFWVIVAFR